MGKRLVIDDGNHITFHIYYPTPHVKFCPYVNLKSNCGAAATKESNLNIFGSFYV